MIATLLTHPAAAHAATVIAANDPAPAAALPVQRILSFLVSYVFPLVLAYIAFKILTRAHQSEMSKNVTTIGNVAIAAVVLAMGGVIWAFGNDFVKSIFS